MKSITTVADAAKAIATYGLLISILLLSGCNESSSADKERIKLLEKQNAELAEQNRIQSVEKSSVPSIDDVKRELMAEFARGGFAITIVSISKTDGVRANHRGVELYTLQYQCSLRAPTRNFVYWGYNLPGNFQLIADFIKTENGWQYKGSSVLRQLPAEVSSSRSTSDGVTAQDSWKIDLIGKWDQGNGRSVEYFADGTFAAFASAGKIGNGSWRIDGEMITQSDPADSKLVLKSRIIELSPNKLTIESRNGVHTYTKYETK